MFRYGKASSAGAGKSGLVRRLEETAALDDGDAAALERFGRACLPTLRAECGQLDPGSPPDQKSVSTLLIQRSRP